MRAGGVTHEYVQGTMLERLMRRGRWQAISTVRRFVQESNSMMMLGRLPEQVTSHLLGLGQHLAAVVDALSASWPELDGVMSLR